MIKVGAERSLHYSMFVALLLICPVVATDFIVSGGVVPISYVLFYFLYLYPSLFILAYWIVVPYVIAFYYLSRLAARRLEAISVAGRGYVVTVLIAALGLLSLFPVYRPISHGGDAWKNIISLFQDEYRLSTRLHRSGPNPPVNTDARQAELPLASAGYRQQVTPLES